MAISCKDAIFKITLFSKPLLSSWARGENDGIAGLIMNVCAYSISKVCGLGPLQMVRIGNSTLKLRQESFTGPSVAEGCPDIQILQRAVVPD